MTLEERHKIQRAYDQLRAISNSEVRNSCDPGEVKVCLFDFRVE